MASAETLTHAFMRSHPAEAGQVLEALPATEAAALFARVPARTGAPVLGAMLPAAAMRALAALDEQRAIELLATLGARQAAALLRRSAEPLRSRLLAGLPTASALAARVLLGHSDDTVGAWADPEIAALSPQTRAGDALERARRSEAGIERIYVVGAGQRLLGTVSLGALLRAGEQAALDSLMTPSEAVLAARTPLGAAAGHPAWRRESSLPVVEAGERLLGVLTREALSRALGSTRARRGADAESTLAGLVVRSYWEALSGLVLSATALLPAVPAVGRRDDER